jgi:hypothetical protein
MADFDIDNQVPVSLAMMAIGSVDTLRGTSLDQWVPNTWNNRTPLLTGPKGMPEEDAVSLNTERWPKFAR